MLPLGGLLVLPSRQVTLSLLVVVRVVVVLAVMVAVAAVLVVIGQARHL